jgi:hypothetical protein
MIGPSTNEGDGMDLLRHCEVCEKPISGEPITDPEEGIDFCAPCAASLLGAERDELRNQLRGAVVLDETTLARGLAALMVTHSPANIEALRRALTSTGGQ